MDDDFLAREDLKDITIYCNPPYALDRYGTGSCAAIEPFVRRLVELASTRGCTCIALVPVLSHQLWCFAPRCSLSRKSLNPYRRTHLLIQSLLPGKHHLPN